MEKSARAVPGVLEADLNFATGVLALSFDPTSDPRKAVVAVVRAAGHGVEEVGEGGQPPSARTAPTWWQLHAHAATLVASGSLIAAGYALGLVRGAAAVADITFAAAALAGGSLTAPRAWASLRVRSLDMNVLMALAVIGAAVLGDFAEAATVIFLFSIGQYLEGRALERTRASIRDLVGLAPALARVRRGAEMVEIPPQDAAIGETLVVRPGERIALDGIVASGASAVDEAAITGEPMPVAKTVGDTVFAGTLNGGSLLEVAVSRVAADSTLARVIHMVEDAQASRAPVQTLVDRFTRWYTPTVVIGALLVAVAPPLLGWGAFADWAYRALVLLVVSCPCALVISTPVAIVSAITRASRDGLLVKGGAYLEVAARVTAIAFDKTGTLTMGRPRVTDVVPIGESDSARILQVAAAMEAGSTHPLAAAVLSARGPHPDGLTATGLADVAGRGLEATVGGSTYGLGSPAFALERGAVDAATTALIEQLETQGKTVLVLFDEHGAQGLIAAADEVRPEAAATLRALRSSGIRHIVMLTGDNERTAAAVAAHAGVTEHRSRLLPQHKVDAVRELAARYGTVAMVGDGINDAPALAASGLGIAMGAAGSDTAMETADVAIMAPDISGLPSLFRLGRRTVRIIRANVAFSIATKAVVLVLAVIGYAPLWLAVFADMGVSLLVTANGLRLLRRS